MKKRTVLVIGGGAAGLMAAGQAAEAGADTTILEKMKQPGRKLGITGKGRCNITNIADIAECIGHFGKTGRFLHQAFARFSNTDLMAFFEGLGLDLVTERGGRVFPAAGKATDVVAVFIDWLTGLNVSVVRNSPVTELLVQDGGIIGVLSHGKKFLSDAVVLATGGASYPLTGSTGDGYGLASSCGHTVVPIRPALVPLETAGTAAQQMAGLNLRNVLVRMLVNGTKTKEAFGEMTFAEFGITGPVILTLSGDTVDVLNNGDRAVFSIDLKPALDEKKLDARLLRDIASRGTENVNSFLRGILPQKMVNVCLAAVKIPADRKAHTITAKERRTLRSWLKDFRLEVTGPRPFAEALVTAGGIDTREINPRTMESRLVKGLYLAGEVLDVHGDTGGYNLQAAFSTGWLAGRNASHR